MKLDNNIVATTKDVQAGVTTFTHQPAAFFVSGSQHTVSVDYKDNTGASFTETWSFTVQNYVTVPAAWAVEPDTTKPGFLWRVHQVSSAQPNTLDRTEAQLAGELGDNIANPDEVGVAAGPARPPVPPTAPIEFVIPTVINLDQMAGNNGNFQPDDQMPGIPGLEGGTDNIAAEILTFVQLPAGLVRMGVNSDDGFRTTVSSGDPRDKGGIVLGFFDGGRGASDTLFQFVVERAGVYAFRTIWEEGGGGANIEWFVQLPDRTKVLINDLSNPNAPKAYRAARTPPLSIAVKFTPLPNQTGVRPDIDVEVQLKDAGAQVDKNSVTMKFDGAAVSPTVTKVGDLTTILLPSTAVLAPGSTHSVELTYNHGSAATAVTRSWSFTVANYPTVPCELGTALGSGDASKPGFRVRVHQTEASQVTSDRRAEDQLAGRLGDNVADPNAVGRAIGPARPPSPSTAPIEFVVESVIELWNSGGQGNWPNDTPNVPGIPGTTGSGDNYAVEVLTYVEFPKAGIYRMGVHSDDGFKVTVAERADPTAVRLGIFDGGRGPSESVFFFNVAVAGVYPLRLIWYEGGGEDECEWYMLDNAGNRVLINDSANPAVGLKAFRARDATKKLVCVVEEAPEISVKRVGDTIELAFKGILETSTDLRTWTAVPGATSPRLVTIEAGAARFWRARRP